MAYYQLLYILSVFFGIAGFSLAFYIHCRRMKKTALVCPLGASCDQVIHSSFSEFMGLPITFLGMVYYALVAIGYTTALSFPNLANPESVTIWFFLSLGAFLFSIYLIFVQAFILRQWCSWCLGSAILSTIIFFLALFSRPELLTLGLAAYKPLIIVIHVLGAALGLGAATVTDVFFFRFLKDFKISHWESYVLSILSEIIWIALAILIASGFTLYLSDPETYLTSTKFLLKMIVIGVIVINGAFLNLKIAPSLVKISFGRRHPHLPGELHRGRRLAFALGAISAISWYSAFFLGLTKSLPGSLWWWLGLYALVLFAGALGSQLVDWYFHQSDSRPPEINN